MTTIKTAEQVITEAMAQSWTDAGEYENAPSVIEAALRDAGLLTEGKSDAQRFAKCVQDALGCELDSAGDHGAESMAFCHAHEGGLTEFGNCAEAERVASELRRATAAKPVSPATTVSVEPRRDTALPWGAGTITPDNPAAPVDEGKIADVLARHWAYLMGSSVIACRCGKTWSVWSEHAKHQAEVMVEALGGKQ